MMGVPVHSLQVSLNPVGFEDDEVKDECESF